MILRIGQLSRGKNKGFTFIELVLVTIIILILVGFIPPLFRKSFSGIQLKETTQNLTQLMRYVQARAIAERKVCRINFDFEQGTFWAEGIKGRWGKTFNVPLGISIKARDEIPSDEEHNWCREFVSTTQLWEIEVEEIRRPKHSLLTGLFSLTSGDWERYWQDILAFNPVMSRCSLWAKRVKLKRQILAKGQILAKE